MSTTTTLDRYDVFQKKLTIQNYNEWREHVMDKTQQHFGNKFLQCLEAKRHLKSAAKIRKLSKSLAKNDAAIELHKARIKAVIDYHDKKGKLFGAIWDSLSVDSQSKVKVYRPKPKDATIDMPKSISQMSESEILQYLEKKVAKRMSMSSGDMTKSDDEKSDAEKEVSKVLAWEDVDDTEMDPEMKQYLTDDDDDDDQEPISMDFKTARRKGDYIELWRIIEMTHMLEVNVRSTK